MAKETKTNGKDKKAVERTFTSFSLAGNSFAIDIAYVKEMAAYKNLIPLTGSADYVEGTVDLYGVKIPVLSLARRLSFDESTGGEGKRGIIVITIDGHVLGLIIDLDHGVEVFSSAEAIKAQKSKEPLSKFLEGTIKTDGDTVNILNPTTLLDDADKAALFQDL
jgi:purine-binding chemotaxis protein CheW